MGEVGETDVALVEKIYILRTTPTPSYPLDRIRFYVDMPVPPQLSSPRYVRKIYLDTLSGHSQFCVRTDANGYHEQFCFDSATREIVSLRASNDKHYQWERTEFVTLGGSRYPGHVLHHDGPETLEMRVKALQAVTTFSESVFTPPPNALMRDWCADPKKYGKPAEPESPMLHYSDDDIVPLYYILVGRDGLAEKWAPVIPASGTIDAAFQRWIHEAKFAIWRCGDKAIEYEQIIVP